jgi:hypothetical protein
VPPIYQHTSLGHAGDADPGEARPLGARGYFTNRLAKYVPQLFWRVAGVIAAGSTLGRHWAAGNLQQFAGFAEQRSFAVSCPNVNRQQCHQLLRIERLPGLLDATCRAYTC